MGQTNSEQSRFLGMALRSVIETVACQLLIKKREFSGVDKDILSNAYKESQTLARKIQAMRNARENDVNYLTIEEDDRHEARR